MALLEHSFHPWQSNRYRPPVFTLAHPLRCDQAAEQICDFRREFARLNYGVYFGTNFKEKGPLYAQNIAKSLEPFDAFLGDNEWLAGANVTWAGKENKRFVQLS